MSWVKLDDQFYWHAKVACLSSDAFRLFVGGLCLCNSFPAMAGVILRSQVPMLFNAKVPERAFKRAVIELVAAGLWEERDEGWAIHDYSDYQPVTQERRAQLQQVGRLGGRPRKNLTETIEVLPENHEVISEKPSENPARVAPVPLPVPVPEKVLPLAMPYSEEALAICKAWEARGFTPSPDNLMWADGLTSEFRIPTSQEFTAEMDSCDAERREKDLKPIRSLGGYRERFRRLNDRLRDTGRRDRSLSVPKANHLG